MKHEHTIWDKLNELRLLVFMENEEGNFQQVCLDDKQFKKVSDAVSVDEEVPPEEKEDLREGYEVNAVRLSDEELDGELFLGMESITTTE